MKRAVTGHGGNIGAEFMRRGYVPIKSNIVNTVEVFQEIQEISPDIIVHCAAITDVGYCEGHDREAFEVNVRGTLNVLIVLVVYLYIYRHVMSFQGLIPMRILSVIPHHHQMSMD